MDWELALAGMQGAAALAIVVLTFFLAKYARGATDAARRQTDVANKALESANVQARNATESLKVAHRQAEVAEAALRASDRQARIAAAGLLRLNEPTTSENSEAGLETHVEVQNPTAEPALDVQVHIHAIETGERLTRAYGTSPQVPILAGGDKRMVSIPSQDVLQVGRSGPARGNQDEYGQVIPPAGGWYAYKKLAIRVTWKSLLGSTAEVTYAWHANAAHYAHAWRLRDVTIRPSGDASDEVVVRADS